MTLALPTAAKPARTPSSVDALMATGPKPAAVFTRGSGSWLWDESGRRYLDFVQGWAVNTLGHAPPEIAEALGRQAPRLLQAGPGFLNDRAVALAQRLAALSGLDRGFITTSGSDANEGAIKLVRKFGQMRRNGAFEVITFRDAFHGRSLATMSASGKPAFEALFEPKVPGFPKARLGDIDSVRALIGPKTIAVMVEPIQGEAGVVEASDAFLRALRSLCDRHGLLLVFDEVQTGIGRTGDWWGHQASGVRPDVMTLGKGLGGGVPIGAVLALESACCFEPGDQGGTYNGNPLVCAAALAVLDAVAAPGFLARVGQAGARLKAGLARCADHWGTHASLSGRGLLLAVDLPAGRDAGMLADALRERASADGTRPGLLVNPVRPHRLRLMPALTVSDAEIDLCIERLCGVDDV